MLMDDLRQLPTDKSKQLFWVGMDARYEMEEDYSDDEMIPKLVEIFESATLYDCTMLSETLNKQWGNKPFRLVRDCFGPLPPYPTTAIELRCRGSRSIVLFESSKVTETPTILRYSLREEALKRPGQAKPYQRTGSIGRTGNVVW
jgi:hypothetical protein